MERKDQRCDQCKEQLKKGRYDKPHHALTELDTKAFRGSMFGGWEETIYICSNCGWEITHSNDKNDTVHWF